MTDQDSIKLRFVYKGGPGSGHHGHSGRPGKRGGSAPGKGGGDSVNWSNLSKRDKINLAIYGGPNIKKLLPSDAVENLAFEQLTDAGLFDEIEEENGPIWQLNETGRDLWVEHVPGNFSAIARGDY